MSVRYFGVVFLSYPLDQRNQDPLEISHFSQDSYAEHCLLSSDEKILFVSDGLNGLTILNISNI